LSIRGLLLPIRKKQARGMIIEHERINCSMMQKIFKFGLSLLLLITILFAATGCVEQHYYHQYHHHTREYYDRHHMPPPAGVNFDIHN
jgi:hypothetical protein